MLEKPLSYLNDMNHFLVLVLFYYLGFPFVISYIFIFGGYLLFLIYFRHFFTPLKSQLAAFISIFGTSFLAHSLYVAIYSQTFAFLFFMVMLIGENRKNEALEKSVAVLVCITHGMNAAVVIFYYIMRFVSTKDAQKLKNSMVYIALFFVILFASMTNLTGVTPETPISEVTKKAMSISANIGVNDYEPPYAYVYMVLMNPTLIGMAANTLNPIYWGFFLASLLGHNGRITLYFIPFMVLYAFKRLNNWSGYSILIISSVAYAYILNYLFIVQTLSNTA